ncbi:MAG: HAMP domain-containing histidine kinase [Candidatus Kapabacteria bacterium]|jgi:signal transduction histidine kinase|nr:HAMP domain-containing histidine kinase [Candidatus Kapabacteria bacterium]
MRQTVLCFFFLFSVSWLCSSAQESTDIAGMRKRADSLQNQATALYKFSGDIVHSIPLWLESLSIWRKLNDSANTALALQVLASGFGSIGDTVRARQYAEESMLLCQQLSLWRNYLSALAGLVATLQSRNNRDSATLYPLFRRGEEVIRTYAVPDSLIPTSFYATKARYALQYRNFVAALLYNDTANRLFARHANNQNSKAFLRNACASKIFTAEVYLAEARYDEALKNIAPVRTDSAVCGQLPPALVLEWYEAAARAFAGMGRFDSAYIYKQAAHAVADTLQKRTNSQTLAYTQVQFDVERKEERLATLEQEKVLQRRTNALLLVGIVLLIALLLLAAWAYRQRRRNEALLRERNSALERLSSEKSEFLRVVAHDLKNPLLSVKMAAEHIASGQGTSGQGASEHDSSAQKTSQTLAHSKAEAIIHTSEAMLNAVKLLLRTQEESPEADFWLNPPTRFDAVKCIKIIVDDFAERAEAKDVSFDFQPSEQVLMLILDEDAFYRVAENLISNAVKYSSKQGKITLQIAKAANRCVFRVSNPGRGISPEEQQRLFQPYSRLSAQPTSNEHSSGLGLSIVKRYVDALGGNVVCESNLGKTTTFIVDLPCATEKADSYDSLTTA